MAFRYGKLSNDMVHSLNKFLKQGFNGHSARGGGKQKATGQSACGREVAFVHSNLDALRQLLQWTFLYFHIHVHQHDEVCHPDCVPMASL